MLVATLIISGRSYLWLAAAPLLGAILLLIWSYSSAPAGFARWVCPILKTIGVAALALCLLEPLWSGQRVKPGANLFAVVADNSQGLQIHDNAATLNRGEALRKLLTARRGDWQ